MNPELTLKLGRYPREDDDSIQSYCALDPTLKGWSLDLG